MSTWMNSPRQFKSERIAAKSNGRCWYCETPLDKQTATYDHVIPRSLGGRTTVDNLVLACQQCNQDKAAMTLTEYRSKKGVKAFYGETVTVAPSAPDVLPK